jgi:hypothetical protein
MTWSALSIDIEDSKCLSGKVSGVTQEYHNEV